MLTSCKPMKTKLVTIIVLFSAFLANSAPGSPKPNVLFIAVDDLNDWIGCMGGHPQAVTPNIDRLAARGVLFTNAHCASPACQPSRAAVFTGLMPEKTGVWSNESKGVTKTAPDAIRIPMAFSAAGYRTMGTGKLIHEGLDPSFSETHYFEQRWSPISHKQSEYTQKDIHTKGSDNPRHVVTDSKGRKVVLPLNRMPSDRNPTTKAGESFDWGPWDVPDSDFGDTKITDWAIDKLEKKSDAPLFLAVGYYRPHIPLWAPERFFERFKTDPGKLPPIKEDDLEDLGETGRKFALEAYTAGAHASVLKHDQWQNAVEAYLACITYVDAEIGRLLDALDRSPHKDNTIIVLWSDHGWHLGEKQHWGKWTAWERSTKVPLIIAPPLSQAENFAKAGSRCDQPVGLIDLFPTLTALCDVKPPEHLDGESLVPLLRDPSMNTGRKLVTTIGPGNSTVRTERWRYILYKDGSQELYDHKNDPNEWTNLTGNPEHAAIISELRESLRSETP